jgi:hypothetical protein
MRGAIPTLVVVTLVGCGAAPPERPVRVRAAYDYGCSEDRLTVTNIYGGSFRVVGCGHDRIYDCFYSSASTCVPEAACPMGSGSVGLTSSSAAP